MSENNSEKAPKGNRSKPGLAASVTTWRALSRKWCEGYGANKETWGDEEWDQWDDLYRSLMLATQALAPHLAMQGVDVGPLNELTRLCRENADAWADHDHGDGRRLRALAAIQRLLQSLDSMDRSPPVLKFPRTPDAKQKCLQALNAAPRGIPRHEDIAATTGLEVQTVKEAMLKLKKAKHVEKKDDAWRITSTGRDHLKMLRGE